MLTISFLSRITALCILFRAVIALDNVYISNYRQNLQRGDVGGHRVRLSSPSTRIGALRPVTDINGNPIPDYDVNYAFEQQVDHTDPTRGTFKQRYRLTWEYYRPGGPIYLFTPGESPIDLPQSELFLTNVTIVGALAQQTNGAVVILEHRFYGESNPTLDHSVESLRLHTIDQAIDDFVYFAQNFQNPLMPGGDGDSVLPHRAPWIFVGGSYAGALGPWIMEQRPGVFWAAYSSSGVVHPQLDFHQYWDVVQQYMPANCSADFRAIIDLVDSTIDAGDSAALLNIQAYLGLENLRVIDFLYALNVLISDWQLLDIGGSRAAQSNFYNFCNALETTLDGEVSTSAEGWGLDIAMRNLAAYVAGPLGYFERICQAAGAPSVDMCFIYSGRSLARMIAPGSVTRSWGWQVCSEVGWQQIGAPEGGGLVSKYFGTEVVNQYCNEAYPGAFDNGTVEGYEARVAAVQQRFRGYETSAERVFVVNGRRDPWIGVSLSSPDIPPSIRVSNSTNRPVYLTDGFHCSDTLASNAALDPGLSFVWQEALRTFERWVGEFTPAGGPIEVPIGGSPSVNRPGAGNDASRRKVDTFLVCLVGVPGLLRFMISMW